MFSDNSVISNDNRKTDLKDFEWAIRLNRIAFSAMGIWPTIGNNRSNIQVFMIIIYLLVSIVMPQMYSLSLCYKNFDLLLQNLLTNIECSATIIKIFILWYDKKAMIPILETLASDWQKMTLGWQHDIMSRVGKQGRLISTFGYIVLAATLFGYTILPAVGFKMHSEVANVTNLNDRYLPLLSTYPYFFSATPYFEMCYISQVIGGGFVATCLTCAASLFGVFVFHVCGQIEILKTEVGNLSMIPIANDTKYWSTIYRDWQTKFGKIIAKHEDIISTVKNIQSYFDVLMIFQFITLPPTLCIVGFQIINLLSNEDTHSSIMGQYVILLASFLSILIQVFIYCFVGETLAYHCDDLNFSIYETQWYAYPEKIAKDLIPMIIRTRHPLRLTAGKYIHFNIDTFCKVLKTVAGYVSVLLAVAES